jgi:hypothetical protein
MYACGRKPNATGVAGEQSQLHTQRLLTRENYFSRKIIPFSTN